MELIKDVDGRLIGMSFTETPDEAIPVAVLKDLQEQRAMRLDEFYHAYDRAEAV